MVMDVSPICHLFLAYLWSIPMGGRSLVGGWLGWMRSGCALLVGRVIPYFQTHGGLAWLLVLRTLIRIKRWWCGVDGGGGRRRKTFHSDK